MYLGKRKEMIQNWSVKMKKNRIYACVLFYFYAM